MPVNALKRIVSSESIDEPQAHPFTERLPVINVKGETGIDSKETPKMIACPF